MSARHLGILMVLASTVPFAFAGVFTRLITADVWSVLAWRGLIGGGVIFLYALKREGARPMGWRGWLLAGVSALASVAFLAAFRLTHVANVALIYTLAPFIAAALDWVIRREPVRAVVIATAGLSVLGVGLVVAGGMGQGRIAGDALALVMTVLMALVAVLIRLFDGVPVLRAMAAAALPLSLAGLVLGAPFTVSGSDLIWLPAFGLSFAFATILMTEGARRIPAAEVALLGGAEVPLVVVLGALMLGEWPPLTTVAGGALVIGAVLWQSWRDLAR